MSNAVGIAVNHVDGNIARIVLRRKRLAIFMAANPAQNVVVCLKSCTVKEDICSNNNVDEPSHEFQVKDHSINIGRKIYNIFLM